MIGLFEAREKKNPHLFLAPDRGEGAGHERVRADNALPGVVGVAHVAHGLAASGAGVAVAVAAAATVQQGPVRRRVPDSAVVLALRGVPLRVRQADEGGALWSRGGGGGPVLPGGAADDELEDLPIGHGIGENVACEKKAFQKQEDQKAQEE